MRNRTTYSTQSVEGCKNFISLPERLFNSSIKIRAVLWVWKGKIIIFNWRNYFQYFMCLELISRSLELRKYIKSNLKSHLIIYFYKNILVVQNWVKTELLKDSFISSISELFFNSNKVLNSYLRCLQNHTILGKKFWSIVSESNWIFFSGMQFNKQTVNKRFWKK